MLQKFYTLLYDAFAARTKRFKEPNAVQDAVSELLKAPEENTEYVNAVLNPKGWTVDAEDWAETLRTARDLMFVGMDPRTGLMRSLIRPVIYADDCTVEYMRILETKYPYCVTSGDTNE